MNELVTATINGTALPVKFWAGVPVVTFKDIDETHQRPAGTAGRNFRKNRNKFEEGVDYYQISADEFRRLIGDMDIRHKTDVVLITEPGYLMLVKSFRDDLSWKVQRELVRFYFAARPDNPGAASNKEAGTVQLPSQEELAKDLGLAGKLLCQYEMVTRKQKEYISVLEKVVDAQAQRLEDIGALAKTASPRAKTTRKPSYTKNGYGIRAFAELCGSNMSTVGVWLESKGYMRRNEKGVLVPAEEYKDSEIFNKIPYAPGGCVVNVNYKPSEAGAKKLARVFKKERRIA